MQDLSDTMLVLLKPIIDNWPGTMVQNTVFNIYSFLNPDRFNAMKSNLEIMESRVLNKRSPPALSAVLSFYTLLLRRWSARISAMETVSEAAAIAVKALVDRANELCLSLISAAPTTSTHFAILDFYDQFTILFPAERIVRHVQLVNLPTSVVYSLLFSPSLAVVSRLCGVLTAYKLAWERIMSKPGRQLSAQERQDVSVFNGFLMDVCNCIWRGRAFALTDPNAQGCGIPARLVPHLSDYLGRLDSELALNLAFTLSYSPSICLQSISYLRALEVEELAKIDSVLQARHAGPVTQKSLATLGGRGGLELNWQEYRTGVLMYLQDSKLEGIPDLMKITMKQLMNARS
jgi:centromere protein I